MGKHETIEATKGATDATLSPVEEAQATLVPGDGVGADEATRSALAAIEALKIETPDAGMPKAETIKPEPVKPEPIKAESHRPPPPRSEPVRRIAAPVETPAEELKPAAESVEMPEPDLNAHDDTPYTETPRRISPFVMMAASLAGAAAFGAMIGALVAVGIARPVQVAAVNPPRIGIEEINAVKEQVVQARVELAQLKTVIDAGHRGNNQQFTKINERVEKIERTQAEPVARLAKAVEALDRFGRGDASKDVTGSIAPPQPIAGGPAKTVDGWVVRDVRRGTAFIEGRMGVIEVDQGDIVPGLGRVESIRRQDGRWIVITSRGVIRQTSH